MKHYARTRTYARLVYVIVLLVHPVVYIHTTLPCTFSSSQAPPPSRPHFVPLVQFRGPSHPLPSPHAALSMCDSHSVICYLLPSASVSVLHSISTPLPHKQTNTERYSPCISTRYPLVRLIPYSFPSPFLLKSLFCLMHVSNNMLTVMYNNKQRGQ